MSSDASAAAASPMTNGTSENGSHREADASTCANGTSLPPSHTLVDVCADLNERLNNFLKATPEDPITRRTQDQARKSFQVIEKALQEYE